RKHHFVALLHEKPFAGINGSGKHNNWSLYTDTGKNLLSPGPDPEANLMFLTFFACVIRAVYEHAHLLQASICSPGNDLRLGQNEAPPGIISVFVGKMLDKVLNDVEKPPRRKRNEQLSELMHLGITEIPEIITDNTDRNRTSPFAFTGSKFEFRAVGASANSAFPMMVLNAIVGAQLRDLKERVDAKMRRGRKQEAALLDLIREYLGESKSIRFEGDGYSKVWLDMAKARGLKIAQHTPDALTALLSHTTKRLFKETGILTEDELAARYRVLMAHYINKIEIEARMLLEMTRTMVMPEMNAYLKLILEQAEVQKRLNGEDAASLKNAGKWAALQQKLSEQSDALDMAIQEGSAFESLEEKANLYAETARPLMLDMRKILDQLEDSLPDRSWPLPKYREMLFIR
ncbi:MAG: glutamine synthetase type III, partial [Bacteroidota bacterium]